MKTTIEDIKHSEAFRNVRKMPALFVIDRVNNVGTEEINATAEWLFTEPATATIKRDGTNITVMEDGTIWARRQVKKGKNFPEDFILAETDPNTGNSFGVEPANKSPFKKFIREAIENHVGDLEIGTYELVGPKVQGNPEGFDSHVLIKHGTEMAEMIPDMTTVDRASVHSLLKVIFEDFKNRGIEGIVWASSDGKRVKLRVKDFFGDSRA